MDDDTMVIVMDHDTVLIILDDLGTGAFRREEI